MNKYTFNCFGDTIDNHAVKLPDDKAATFYAMGIKAACEAKGETCLGSVFKLYPNGKQAMVVMPWEDVQGVADADLAKNYDDAGNLLQD